MIMAIEMPVSSTHLLSLTIGNGIPTHVAGVSFDDIIFILRLSCYEWSSEIKKAGSDIQNRL